MVMATCEPSVPRSNTGRLEEASSISSRVTPALTSMYMTCRMSSPANTTWWFSAATRTHTEEVK